MLIEYDPTVRAVINYLRLLGAKVNNATVNETLQNHPDWPSLLCVSDSLSKWRIPNAAGRIDKDEIDQLPLPFLAPVEKVGPFVVVKEITETEVGYFPHGYKRYTVAKKEDFFKDWGGVYLIAESNENSGEDIGQFRKGKRHARIRALIQGSLLLLLLFASIQIFRTRINNLTPVQLWSVYLQFFIFMAGLAVTLLLLWYEVDDNNPLLQKVCTGLAKTNCRAVLNSAGARLFNWISWSEVGFIYFSGGLLLLLFSPGSLAGAMAVSGWLSLLAVPYPVFSVWYQWKVAKQWCLLCLGVQFLLVIAAVNTIAGGLLHTGSDNPFELLFGAAVCFLLPALIWAFGKPFLFRMQKARRTYRDYLQIKFNEEIFDTLLKKQMPMKMPVDGLGIDIGNAGATNTLVKICNPYCGPCSRAHRQIEELLEQHGNLRVKIIFTVSNDDNDRGAIPARHLMALAAMGDESLTKQALDDWYLAETKDYNVFANKYPLNGELAKQGPGLEAMSSWCREMKVAATPTIFFNGYRLPSAFNIDEIKYFLWE
jgi:uncharacterized membrane protein